RRRKRGEVVRAALDEREVRNAEDSLQPVARFTARGVIVQLDFDAAHQRAHREDVQALERLLDVPDEHPDEPRAVAALWHQRLVVDDDRGHGWRASAAARWPLRTALSIVAGRPVSIQSPARKKPRTPVSAAGRTGCPGASEKVARGSRTTVPR